MNNQELELKLKEILNTKNFFNAMEMVVSFEKEYKNTDFFKKTRMPLLDVVKESKMWYIFQFDDITLKIQEMINDLDFAKIIGIIDQFGDVYAQENEDITNILKDFKSLVK